MISRTDTDSIVSAASLRTLYAAGAVLALVTFGASLLDIFLTMVPGWGTASVPVTAHDWLRQMSQTPLLGLRNLDVLNITVSMIGLPMYAAIAVAQRRREPALAALGLLIVTVGTALFVANNAGLPMLELGRRYAEAAGAGQRAALEAAGEALLARGAHGSFGAFTGFFVSEVGTLLVAVGMIKSRMFGRAGWFGTIGALILMLYTVGYTFMPGSEDLVMVVAIPGGLLMMAWNVLVARTLFGLARAEVPSSRLSTLRQDATAPART